VKIMYRDVINVSQGQPLPTLKVAEILQMSRLADASEAGPGAAASSASTFTLPITRDSAENSRNVGEFRSTNRSGSESPHHHHYIHVNHGDGVHQLLEHNVLGTGTFTGPIRPIPVYLHAAGANAYHGNIGWSVSGDNPSFSTAVGPSSVSYDLDIRPSIVEMNLEEERVS
jgi:hypothetical protein